MNKEQLRALRKSYHLTQSQLAKLVGITPQHYCRLENGASEITAQTLSKIKAFVYCETLKRISMNTSTVVNSSFYNDIAQKALDMFND